MIKILIADDHTILRDGLRQIVEQDDQLTVVGEAATSQEVLKVAGETEPDVVLLDIQMPGRGPLETLQELKRLHKQVAVLILTAQPEDYFAVRYLKAGAAGYMTKDQAGEQLLSAVKKVHTGGRYISDKLAERIAMSLDSDFSLEPHERLSERELQVMRLLAAGRTPTQIAEELCLSVKTISTYRTRILEKLNLQTTPEIMMYSIKLGLIDSSNIETA